VKVFSVPLVVIVMLIAGAGIAIAAAITYEGALHDGTTTGSTSHRAFQQGRIQDADFYSFDSLAGRIVDIEVHRLDSAMDPIMFILDGTIADSADFVAAVIARAHNNNGIPHGVGGNFADPKLTIVIPADGTYSLVVADLFGAGPGPSVDYEIHIFVNR